tara:strand:- start:107 stop:1231 length:1125 start_codon:yes stop_codon:yes gene_type:complete
MLQNKIYQNFYLEILKTFFIIVFGLSLIALTVRAVNFLELIVDNGYPVSTYFMYSFLNLFGIAPKFIPLAFLVALTIFIIKHQNDREFLLLWTSGVKKIKIVNLIIFSSLSVLIIYLFLSIFLTPYALNKSRLLLGKDQLNSFLPTIRSQQFSDSFKGFTFIVEKKFKNEIEHIFLHDTGKNIKNLSSDSSDFTTTTIIADKGMIDKRKMILFNGQIISSKYENLDNEIIKFTQLNIDLNNLATTTIKQPKIQETSTIKLLNCFIGNTINSVFCSTELKKEVVPILIRRIVLPFYIPVLALICSILLIRNKKVYFNKIFICSYSFLLLVFTELLVRYTGLSFSIRLIYIFSPFILSFLFYILLIFKFSKESKLK